MSEVEYLSAREIGVRICSKCKAERSLIDFYRDRSKKSGYGAICKLCQDEYSRQYRERIGADAFAEILKRSRLRTKFGITLEQYYELLNEQQGRCAICRTDEPNGRGAMRGFFSVDHDHTTGDVRGLLCSKCNSALGFFNDNFETLQAAARYLEGTKNV